MAETTSNGEVIVGVDLGGTKILSGVFNQKLDCLGRNKVSTKAERGPEEVVERIVRSIHDAVDECDLEMKNVRAVGVGAPGAVDPDEGTVIFAPNLEWRDIPLRKLLQKELDLPIFIENDCNSCALGVHQVEFDGKPRHLVGIFIGTGIGAGLILDGKLYSGSNRSAGEIGHMILDPEGPKCGCGNKGCFEAFASRTALFNKIHAAVKAGQKTILTEMLGPALDDLRSGHLRKAIQRGDRFVQQLIEEAARYTGIAVGNLINLLNPEKIVLGGGVIDQLANEIIPVVQSKSKEVALKGTSKGIDIVASKLGDDAGITGAAVIARRGR